MKGHKINEGGIMKVNDLVMYKGNLGVILQIKVHDLVYTKYTICKVEFENNRAEWINKMYLRKLVKG